MIFTTRKIFWWRISDEKFGNCYFILERFGIHQKMENEWRTYKCSE